MTLPPLSTLQFARGYLITPASRSVELPAVDGWTVHRHASAVIRVHPEASVHTREAADGATWILLGHAYDPWRGEADEGVLLGQLEAAYSQSDDAFLDGLDRLSGRFALFVLRDGGGGFAVQDAVGLKTVFYADTADGPCFASHSQLLADALGLERDPEIDRLVSSWFYGIGIRHLPGLRTPFRGMRMLSANTRLTLPDLSVERIFPRGPHPESDDLEATARTIGDVFDASFRLLRSKKPLALSLSMGTDSRVSLAASRKHRDAIHYFSYISDSAEEVDALGAHELCRRLGVEHTIYRVPVGELASDESAELSAILDHNAAYVRAPKAGERAKLHYLLAHFPGGMMEVKTPVSEIGRAIYCKKMGVDKLPERITPRHMSNLYKRNLFDRESLRVMDEAFEEYAEVTAFGRDFYNYEEHDMFYWEHRNSAWASLANQDHDVIHDMTVVFNNRNVLSLLLSPSRSDRIADRLHHEIIRYLWPEVLQIPLSQKTSPKQKARKLAERVFFAVNRF